MAVNVFNELAPKCETPEGALAFAEWSRDNLWVCRAINSHRSRANSARVRHRAALIF